MRDVNRIDPFVQELRKRWKDKIPDWRFCQFMSNFLGWVYSEKHIDPFFVEDDMAIEYLKEFLK